jgi:3-deoxy-D-manno-octulosonic acid (KDO) 8-phosphate synthase
MEHIDAIQIIAMVQKQTELLKRIANASERANEVLWLLLSPEQKQALQKNGAERLAKSLQRSKK